MSRNECCTGLAHGRYWIYDTGVLGHCINDDPIPFAFLGMVVWGEAVLYLVGHAKHRLHEKFLVGTSGLENFSNPSFDMRRQSTSTVVPLERTSGVTIWWPAVPSRVHCPTVIMRSYQVPFPTREHHMEDELSGMIEYSLIGLIFGSSLRNILTNPKQTVIHSPEVPDLTHEVNVELFWGRDREEAGYLQMLRYIRIPYIKHRPRENRCVTARSAPSSSLGHQGGDSGGYDERIYRDDGYHGVVVDDDR